ncbi:MAG: hypothetical protein RL113_208 [Pseudomonadota bacterium]|jgi:pyrroline-5-carboxylate reductase
MQTITFIGNGNMALSIANGLKKNYTIEVVGRNQDKLLQFEKALGTQILKHDINDFNMEDKTVMLCVKPQNVDEIQKQLQGTPRLLLSVLAGTSIATLKKAFHPTITIRSMPNLAASVGKSMTTLTGDEAGKAEALTLMQAIGSTLWLRDENAINIATALAGSGPAYLALFANGLVQGAIEQGLSKEESLTLMRGLFDGFGTIIQNEEPLPFAKRVMSPKGTTEAGCKILEEGALEALCKKTIKNAYDRAIELSQNK